MNSSGKSNHKNYSTKEQQKIVFYEVTSPLKINNWNELAMEQYLMHKQKIESVRLNHTDLEQNLKEQTSLLHHYIKLFNGKPSIDFHDQQAVISLTKCIMKVIFKLQWSLPIQNLCPRIPNRLNYLIWIDRFIINIDRIGIIDSKDIKQEKSEKKQPNANDITGLDIGTGASLIYPLLGVRVFNWKFIATQIQDSSLTHAQHLINQNNLSSSIKLLKSNSIYILKNTIPQNTNITFLMCNPPFFDSHELNLNTLSQMTQSQHNTFGGEYDFFFRIYLESFYFRNVQCFTMMIGLGRDFQSIKKFLVQEYEQYQTLDWIKFGKLNQSENTRFIVAWKINKQKLPFSLINT